MKSIKIKTFLELREEYDSYLDGECFNSPNQRPRCNKLDNTKFVYYEEYKDIITLIREDIEKEHQYIIKKLKEMIKISREF